jgi:hypothetical protein
MAKFSFQNRRIYMKTKHFFSVAVFAALAAFAITGCGNYTYNDGINWDGDNGGTLELVNGSNKDMIMFLAEKPSPTTIIGGVQAGQTRSFDVCKHVSDCPTGGYGVLRGVTKEQYDKYGAEARVEFNQMITYRSGTKYRYNINPAYLGDYGFKVHNVANLGVELRKNSPDGEKISYLGALQQNQIVYASSTDDITIFPVYILFNISTGEITSVRTTDMRNVVSVGPRLLTDQGMYNLYFPPQGVSWESILGDLKFPTAYVTVINNAAPGRSARFTVTGTRDLISQNGYNSINAGERLLYEVEAGEDGPVSVNLVVMLTGGVPVPVRFRDEETGLLETASPQLENGFNYTVEVEQIDQDVTSPSSFTAEIKKGSQRDISSLYSTL